MAKAKKKHKRAAASGGLRGAPKQHFQAALSDIRQGLKALRDARTAKSCRTKYSAILRASRIEGRVAANRDWTLDPVDAHYDYKGSAADESRMRRELRQLSKLLFRAEQNFDKTCVK